MNFTGSGESSSFEQPQPGLCAARIYKIVDLGTQEDSFQGQPKKARKMMVWWELGQKMADGRPFSIFLEYNQFLGSEKAKLRKHLESWAGQAMTPESIKAFNPKTMMLGKACMVNLVKTEAGKVKVDGLMSIPQGMPKPEPHNPQVFLDLDAFDAAAFEALPEWVKDKIAASPEFKKLNGAAAHGATPPSDEDADIPFGSPPPQAPPAAEEGKPDVLGLAAVLSSAPTKEAFGAAWGLVVKQQHLMTAAELTSLGKIKRDKEAFFGA